MPIDQRPLGWIYTMAESLMPSYMNQTSMTPWLMVAVRAQGVYINNSWIADNTAMLEPNPNVTAKPDFQLQRPFLAIVLAVFCAVTVFGNVLVMVAVAKEQYLHTVTNYFIASLATADCLVGALVMPFSAVYHVMGEKWLFGQDWCDTWHSLDVLASTASILNLCVISLDRYWAITDPMTYPGRMTPTKAGFLIALVWVCSALISFPAIAWWRAVDKHLPSQYQCHFTDDVGYLVFSSTISFYGPLTVMVFTYFRIYRAAAEQTRSLKTGCKQVQAVNGNVRTPLTLRMHRGGMLQTGSYRSVYSSIGSGHEDGCHRGASFKVNNKTMKSFSLSRKLSKLAKERKAAKTLGIVMGVFILCWLPFFVVNVLGGICGDKCIVEQDLVVSILTWLGWLNSGMNPVIYACWSKDFRRAFTKYLCSCFPGYMRKKSPYRSRLRRTLREDIGMCSMKSSATEEVHL